MIREIQETDRVIKNQGWNAVIVFDGKVQSINMLKNNMVEIRYVLNKEQDFEHNKLDPKDYGIEFDERGYSYMKNPV